MVRRRVEEGKPWGWAALLIAGIVVGAYLAAANYNATILGVPAFAWLLLDVGLLYVAYLKVRDYL